MICNVWTRAHNCQGVKAPWTLAFSQKVTGQQYQDPDDAKIQRRNQRGGGQGHIDAELHATGEPPRGWQGPMCIPRAAKGGAHRHSKRRQMQARSAGRRDDRRRLTGGGLGQHPGGRRFAMGEEVGSGWNKRDLTMNGNEWEGGRK